MFDDDFQTRFGGIGRLYGIENLERIQKSHVCVIGLGGVGSWTVEALARSGVGGLTLVDLDEVCVSNTNRQLHAIDRDIGKPKAMALAERIQSFYPNCQIHSRIEFFTTSTAERILSAQLDVIVDAIDHVSNKCLLIAECKQRKIPVVTCGGGGGRKDPARIRVADLSRTEGDPLLAVVRKHLRQNHGFSKDRKKKWGVPCVFSDEPPLYPQSDGTVCATRETGSELRLNCESGYGTATFMTGTIGFHLAAMALEAIVSAKT